jgi:PIN domain nuclease of toxin-antitoxin system
VTGEPAAVLDTHALIHHTAGGKHLGRRAAGHFEACEARAAIAYVPVAVIWEFSLLVRSARINLEGSVSDFFETLFSNPAYQPVDMTAEHVFLAEEVRPNNDPFDGLICAAALDLDLPLITRDRDIEDSRIVRTLW